METSDFTEKQKKTNEANNRSLLGMMYNKEPENHLILYTLGRIYTEGKVFQQDDVEGYKWFFLSSELGNKDAEEARDSLEKKMNSSQISEAQTLIEEIRSKGAMNLKACTKCNRLKPESAFCKIASNKDGRHYVCKECDKKRSAQYVNLPEVRAKREKWRLEKESEGYYRYGKGAIAKLRGSAERRNISFSLTSEILEEWWENTPDICCYCKVTIDEFVKIRDFIKNYNGTNNNILKFKRFFQKGNYSHIKWMTIDRKDNHKGYEINNIAKACWICNCLKGDIYSKDQFDNIGFQIISDLKKEISKEIALS